MCQNVVELTGSRLFLNRYTKPYSLIMASALILLVTLLSSCLYMYIVFSCSLVC
jgi:hypothetical protein